MPEAVSRPDKETKEPGEFTRLMEQARTPEAAAPPSGSKPDEFDAMFHSPLAEGDLARQDLSEAKPLPAPEKKEEPGEYTRLFKIPAPPPASASADATQAFSGRPEPEPEPVEEAVTEEEGPSEFTRIIQAGAVAGPEEPPAAESPSEEAEAEPPRKGVPVWLIVTLIVLLIAAVAVILYFVLKD